MTKKEVKKREWLNFNSAMLLLVILALFVILKTAFTPPEIVRLLEDVKTDLVEEAEIVLDTLTNGASEVSLLDSNELIEEKIRELDKKDYNEIKSMLGVKSDFCIFFEDLNGNPVKIGDINSGVGSDKIYINGKSCE